VEIANFRRGHVLPGAEYIKVSEVDALDKLLRKKNY